LADPPEPDSAFYEAVWPLSSRRSLGGASPASLGGDLENMRVAFVWDYLFRGDEIFELLEESLAERFPGMTFVGYERFGDIHSGTEDEFVVLEALPSRLKAESAHAVIVGVGG
jgi:hypothetical protein